MPIAVVCPGQGAQTPGFLTEWLQDNDFRAAFAELDPSGELERHGTVSDAGTIRDTAVAQPLIVAASLAAARRIEKPDIVAGHSVGEFAAAAIAGVITPKEAVDLVTIRGRAMANAAAMEQTGMSAVLGGDWDTVRQELENLELTAANVNGAGQVVAAGRIEQLRKLEENPPKGARVKQLQVAGAFHTSYMAPAVEELHKATTAITPKDPTITLLSNRDGESVSTGAEVLERLVDQVSRQVRWDLCLKNLKDAQVVIELPPAGALTGLVKRELPGTPRRALRSPKDL